MTNEFFWEVDPRTKWKNHFIVDIEGKKYSVELRSQDDSSGNYSSVFVHVYNFDERAPYSETVLGVIEFGNDELYFSNKRHSSVSRYEEILVERPRNFNEQFFTDIITTSERATWDTYPQHIKNLLSVRSERLAAEDNDSEIKLPYES